MNRTIKGLATATIATALLWTGSAPAAQTGALATTVGRGGFAVSASTGYAERDVEDGVDAKAANRRLAFRAQFGVAETLDLYALLGFADLEIDHTGFSGTLGENLGLGVRYSLLEFADSDARLVLDMQGEYIRSSDGSDRVRQQTYHVATYLMKEFGAAGRTGYFYPYGGIRVSYARYEGSGLDDFISKDFVGVFGGADYFVNPNVFFSGEVHVFDETSLYLGVGYRF
ncbi:MAG TPA: hypothetical protein VK997_06400 [Deferrisomatales bacterium]|nr:hypothetical protein [Deferrisomatales bacterium]